MLFVVKILRNYHLIQSPLEKRMRVHVHDSPKVLIHGLEEELIVRFIEDLFKVQQ